MARRLRHVYWLGGGSGAGKSTIARRLAASHGARLYDTDEMMSAHARRSTPTDSPYLAEFIAMSMDERWLHRTPATMLETFHWFRGEGFGFIVEDLLRLPGPAPVLVEGFRLLPHLVAPLLSTPTQAVFLIPTPDFRRTAFDQRGSTWRIAGQTSDPPRALANLLARDDAFTDRVRAEAHQLTLPFIEVYPGLTEDVLATRVSDSFGW